MQIPTDLLKAAHLFAAKKDARNYLESVYIEWRDDTAKIIATDGHRMFVASCEIEPNGDGSCIIPFDTVKRALTGYKHDTIEFCPPQATHRETAAMGDSDNVVDYYIAKYAAKIGSVTFEPTQAEYPDWRRVVPAEASGEAAQFNAAYIGELGKAARLLLKPGKTMPAESLVHIHHNGTDGALVTFGARADCLAVLMPKMRDEMVASEALNIAQLIKA